MNRCIFNDRRAAWLVLAIAAVALLAPNAWAGDDPSPGVAQAFQFSDSFYTLKGIDTSMVLDHYVFPDAKFPECSTDPSAPGCRTALEPSPDPAIYNNTRVIETTAGWRHNGNILFYISPSKLVPDSFARDASGNLTQAAAETKALCEEFDAFLFPKTDRDAVNRGEPGFIKSPALPNRRQDNIFETNGGYWSNNPLGCWTLTFVVFDGPNFDGEDCQEEIQKVAADNGWSLDGDTPIIQDMSDIEKFVADGCATLNPRASDGSEGFPWVI